MGDDPVSLVRELIAQGYSRDVIIQRLVRQGYSHDKAEQLYEQAAPDDEETATTQHDSGGAHPTILGPLSTLFSKQALQLPVFAYVGISIVYRLVTLQIDGFMLLFVPLFIGAFIRGGKDAAFAVAAFYLLFNILFWIGLATFLAAA